MDNKIYSANDVLIMLDDIQRILRYDNYVQAYDKLRDIQDRLVKIRDGSE